MIIFTNSTPKYLGSKAFKHLKGVTNYYEKN